MLFLGVASGGGAILFLGVASGGGSACGGGGDNPEGMTLSGQVQMDFSALADGVYQVRLTAGQASAIQQLMIRH